MAEPATRPIDLPNLAGVWRRSLMIEPDGRRDTISAVWWLQAGPLAGDIRAPGPGLPATSAFAGTLARRGDVFRWSFEHAWGYRPDAPPDEGRLRWEGDHLREDGVHVPYVEHWCAEPGGAVRAGRFAGGMLIEIGDLGFCAREAGGGAAFLLATRDGQGWRVLLAANPSLPTGAPVAWPEVGAGRIRFAAGPLGPAASLLFAPLAPA